MNKNSVNRANELLIVPYGIETHYIVDGEFIYVLLIVPYGIETN